DYSLNSGCIDGIGGALKSPTQVAFYKYSSIVATNTVFARVYDLWNSSGTTKGYIGYWTPGGTVITQASGPASPPTTAPYFHHMILQCNLCDTEAEWLLPGISGQTTTLTIYIKQNQNQAGYTQGASAMMPVVEIFTKALGRTTVPATVVTAD